MVEARRRFNLMISPVIVLAAQVYTGLWVHGCMLIICGIAHGTEIWHRNVVLDPVEESIEQLLSTSSVAARTLRRPVSG